MLCGSGVGAACARQHDTDLQPCSRQGWPQAGVATGRLPSQVREGGLGALQEDTASC